MILDTTVLIAAERDSVALHDLVADDDDLAMAALTVAELWVGVELADRDRRGRREALVESLVATISIESYDLRVASAHAGLLADTRRRGRPRGSHDLIIAATAIASDRTLVTYDARGFSGLPGLDMRSGSSR